MTLSEIESNEEVLLKSLLRFYKSNDQHLRDVANISGGKTIISLREMDFTVTKYSKKHKVSYDLPDGTNFNMSLDYKAQLRGHSKRQFDPFNRMGDKNDKTRLGRIFLDFETKTPIYLKENTKEEVDEYRLRTDGVVTNVGQLNFFKWAINNKVVEYCFKNKESIVEDMDEEYRAKKEAKAQAKAKTLKVSNDKLQKPLNQKIQKVIIHFP